MQNNLFSIVQTAVSNNSSNHNVKKDTIKGNSFEKCMSEYANLKKEETVEKSENVEINDDSNKEELDITLLQELAAMQMVSISPETINSPEVTVSEQVVVNDVEIAMPENEKQISKFNEVKSSVQEVVTESENKVIEEAETKPVIEQKTHEVESNLEKPIHKSQKGSSLSDSNQNNFEFDDTQTEKNVSVFGEVETIPVKISETTNVEKNVETDNVETQVADKIIKTVSLGQKKVELQLNPEHLGKISIEVVQKEDGSLSISLKAEHSDVKILLERVLPEMQQLLRNNTQQNVQIQVNGQEQQKELYDEQHHQQHHGHQQENENNHNKQTDKEDFLHQLRLGLIHSVEIE